MPARKKTAPIEDGPPITETETAPIREEELPEMPFPITETETSLASAEEAPAEPPDERFPITETETHQGDAEMQDNLQNFNNMQEPAAPILITESETAIRAEAAEISDAPSDENLPPPTTETKTVRRRTRRMTSRRPKLRAEPDEGAERLRTSSPLMSSGRWKRRRTGSGTI